MSDGYHDPLENADAYLERIGVARVRAASLDYLDELVYSHQCTVPFENLDIYEKGLAPSLDRGDLFQKIVTSRRGGYCFELNSLFCALLAKLGYDVQPSMARVLLRPNPHPMISHRASIVVAAGKRYLVDVGFGGPMPPFALPIEEGHTRSGFGHAFTVRQADEHWWDLFYTGSSGEERPVLRFCMLPAEEQDFVSLSYYQSQSPASVFTQRRQANIRTEGGSCDLLNTTLTERLNGEKRVTELSNDALLDEVLARKFGIEDWR